MQKIKGEARVSTGDLHEAGWSQLSQELASKLSPTIVSLASFDNGTIYKQCTGIVIRNSQSRGASFLTSSDFLTQRWFNPSLTIKVRLPDGELVQGVVQHYDLPCRMLVVTTEHSPDLRQACLTDSVQVEPLTELFAARRCYDSSKLMARSGELIESPDGVDSEGFMFTTCGITATGTGGPLVDLDGNIVWMNCYDNGSIYDERVLAMTIKVRLPNDEVVDGSLQDYMGSYNLVLVTTDPLSSFPDLHLACLSNSMQVESAAEVLAVRRCFKSGKLMTTGGVLIDGPSGVVSNGLKLSTCKITENASGGPLVDFDGNIVGMSYYGRKTAPYIPSDFICECFGSDVFLSGSNQDDCRPSQISSNEMETSSRPINRWEEVIDHVQPSPIFDPTRAELTDDDLKRILDPWPSDDNDVFTKKVNKMLCDSGYPLPSFADGGMYLKCAFEEKFGKDICSKTVEKVASKMSPYVVALASFDDEGRRHFACTGILIECNNSTTKVLTSASLVRASCMENKIHKLRIEVCLRSKECLTGTLEHYGLPYNVAVVSFSGDSSHRGVKLSETLKTEVVALGRGFRSGELMFTDGVVTGKRSRFDCEELQMSTCEITKAGIGGPLVDFDGNFVGLNFYDMENTPYLPRDIILEFISQFNAERTVAAAEVAKESEFNRWPVPDPYWVYPTRHRQPSYPSDGDD